MEKVYLDKIQLINCQSHEDTVLSFSRDKINVIMADNNIGKSVLFKMLRVTASPNSVDKAYRQFLIRNNKEFARIIYAFSNHDIGVVDVYVNGVVYYYRENGEVNFTSYREIPEKLYNNLGLLVEDKFITNIIDTDQELFLVNSDGSCDSKLLKLMTTDNNLDLLQERVEENLQLYNDLENKLKNKIVAKKAVLDTVEYTDIVELNDKIETSKFLYSVLYNFVNIGIELDKISRLSETRDFTELIRSSEILFYLKEIRDLTYNLYIEHYDDKYLQLANNCISLVRLNNIISNYKYPNKNYATSIEKLNLINKLLNIRNNLKYLNYKSFNFNMNYIYLLEHLKQISNILRRFDSINNSNKQLHLELEKYYNYLLKNNQIIKCELYGEVLFDGKKCVPFNK